MYGKKAYNKMWDGIKEKFPLPDPPKREKRVSRDDPRLKEKAARADADRTAAKSAPSAPPAPSDTAGRSPKKSGKKERPAENQAPADKDKDEEGGQLAYAEMMADKKGSDSDVSKGAFVPAPRLALPLLFMSRSPPPSFPLISLVTPPYPSTNITTTQGPLDTSKRRRSVAAPTPTKDRRKGMATSAQPERPRAESVQDNQVMSAMDEVEWNMRNRADSEDVLRAKGLLGKGHAL